MYRISILSLTVFLLSIQSLWANTDNSYQEVRLKMVDEQIKNRGVDDERVLEAMRKVHRHLFVPKLSQRFAYQDHPLSIGHGQTISQPYIVGFMTAAAMLKKDDRVLEIGTGSGYQAAILAEIVKEVYTIEIVKPLAETAKRRLEKLGYRNISVKEGDGYQGWSEHGPFDAIIVTAAPAEIPQKLVDQLILGGRMVVPVGSFYQDLFLVTKTDEGIKKDKLLPVRFVPMIHAKEN